MKSVSYRVWLLSTAVPAMLLASIHAEAAEGTAADENVETIVVSSTGEARHSEAITDATIQEFGAGSSPFKALAMLPSVNYTASDAYGTDEFGLKISMRGFNQNQLGFTLDDVPLGDMSYGNWNGLHISRAIINENISRATVSQGTGSLSTASNSNLGGTIQFSSIDPSEQFHVRVDQGVGSNDLYRTYARLDSGQLTDSGTKFAFSFVHEDENKWKGGGDLGQPLYQINFKMVQPVGDTGAITIFTNYSDHRESENATLSLEQFAKLGYKWDYTGNWAQSIQAAQQAQIDAAHGAYNYPVPAVNELSTASEREGAIYYGGSSVRKDFLGGGTYATELASEVNLKSTVYGHWDQGAGLWFAPTALTPLPALVNGSPIALRTTEYTINRYGDVSSVKWEHGDNSLETGFWLENNDFDIARRWYATSVSSPVYDLLSQPSNPYETQWAYHYSTTVAQGYIEDKLHITDTLTASAGVKLSDTWTTGNLTQYVGAASGYSQGTLFAGNKPLPQVGVVWDVTSRDEIFFDAAKNLRAFVAGGPGIGNSPWQNTQTYFDKYVKEGLKPETSISEEIGYRMTRDFATVETSAFHTDFSNRLLAALPAGVSAAAGVPNILTNVGGVRSDGLDLAVTNRLPGNLSFYNGFTWNRSVYMKDMTVGGVLYNTEGKTTVDTPRILYKTNLSWQPTEEWSAHLGGSYTGQRYYSYVNDAGSGSYFIADAGVAYESNVLGEKHGLRFQFNVSNLLDRRYVSTYYNYANSDPKGTSAGELVGAPRMFSGSVSVRW
jgi:iron complex outermembrane receptor protein